MLKIDIKDAFKTRVNQQPTKCIDPEILASYIENTTSEELKGTVEQHLVSCDTCLDTVSLSSLVIKEEKDETEIDLFDSVIISFLTKSIEFLADFTRVEVLPSTQFGTTRNSLGPSPDKFSFRKQIYNAAVDIEVGRISNSSGEIKIKLLSNGAIVDGARVNFLREGKELASYLTDRGTVMYEYNTYGKYTVIINKNADIFGVINLHVKKG